MNNIEYLQKELKKNKIIMWACIPLALISFTIIGIYANITILATIAAIIGIISIIIGLLAEKKIKILKKQIYDVGTMTQALQDVKEDKTKE